MNNIIFFLKSHWQPIIAIISVAISFFSFIISVNTIWQSRKESILLNRAYVNNVTWNTSDLDNQFQFSFLNSGNTPAIDFKVTARLFVNDKNIREIILAENQVIPNGLSSDRSPRVPFNFSDKEIEDILSSEQNYIQIEFSYKDYVGSSHIQKTDFKVFKIINKYQIQPIRQNIVQ